VVAFGELTFFLTSSLLAPTVFARRTADSLTDLPYCGVVQYLPFHSAYYEWVWNRADIDGSKVVRAGAVDDAKKRELSQHFPDWEVWLIQTRASKRAALVP